MHLETYSQYVLVMKTDTFIDYAFLKEIINFTLEVYIASD